MIPSRNQTTTRTLEGGRKKIIEYAGYRVILRMDKDGKNKKWILTGYRLSKKRKNPDETAQFYSLEQLYKT